MILSQTDGVNTWYFQYDTNGIPLGFIYNGTQYFYMTNQMGDVIGIFNSNGEEIAGYEYDEWGKPILAYAGDESDETQVKIANTNPLLYRGYYYDYETGYYYLQSRYYDPSICRFINSDIVEMSGITKDVQAGTNLFAYCNNDPMNNSDPTGFARSRINFGTFFGKVSIVSAVLSAIGTLSLVAFRKTPWGKMISLAITFASVATNVYSYSKAVNSAKKHYGKNSSKYKQLLKYNNVILASNIAFIIICEVLSKSIVKRYSATVAVALIGCRTITISGMAINIAELLSGKSIIYRDRLRR